MGGEEKPLLAMSLICSQRGFGSRPNHLKCRKPFITIT
jgi:hypothetical protein